MTIIVSVRATCQPLVTVKVAPEAVVSFVSSGSSLNASDGSCVNSAAGDAAITAAPSHSTESSVLMARMVRQMPPAREPAPTECSALTQVALTLPQPDGLSQILSSQR